MVDESATPVPTAGSVDAEIARLASAQHGAVTAAQLRRAGLTHAAISKRARKGRLHRLHRGVYAVGHVAPSLELEWMGAVLACGDGAVLSHRSAAALWGLLDPVDGPVEVSVPSAGGRERRQGIRVHRRARLGGDGRAGAKRSAGVRGEGGAPPGRRAGAAWHPPPALTRRDGIPVTAPWLTVEDLRDVVPAKLYRRALRQAELRRFALSPSTPRDRTRSDLERDFLQLCHAHGLPAPAVNVRVGRWTVDFLWRERRLAVETDSWGTHRGSVAFEDDHARDLDLRAAGFRVRRYTEQQIAAEPESVATDLAEALAAAARPPR